MFIDIKEFKKEINSDKYNDKKYEYSVSKKDFDKYLKNNYNWKFGFGGRYRKNVTIHLDSSIPSGKIKRTEKVSLEINWKNIYTRHDYPTFVVDSNYNVSNNYYYTAYVNEYRPSRPLRQVIYWDEVTTPHEDVTPYVAPSFLFEERNEE